MFDALKYVTIDEDRADEIPNAVEGSAWYNISTGEAYTAVLDFLEENLESMRETYDMPEAQRMAMAFEGDWMAKFVMLTRGSTTAEVLSIPESGWILARQSRDELPEGDSEEVVVRAQALEAVRHFFMEAHHQQTNFAPRGLTFDRAPEYRLGTEKV